MQKIKIACMTYKKLGVLAREAISDINDPCLDISVIDTTMEDLLYNVKQALLTNVDVFIAGGSYAEIIHTNIKKPVINIKLSAMDFLKAIVKAKKYGKNIAIVSFESTPNFDFEEFERILDVKIFNLVFEETYDLELQLKNSKIDVVIGGSVSNDIASKYNIPNVLIYKGKDSIFGAIEEAKRLAIALFEEKRKSDLFQSILNFNPSGIIITDENGKIVVVNPAAEEITNIPYEKAVGKNLSDIIKNFDLNYLLHNDVSQSEETLTINNNNIVLNAFCIEQDNTSIGVLLTIEKISSIIQSDKDRQITNIKNGFKAKNTFSNIIGHSNAIEVQINKSKKYSRSNSSVLIYGETGVGKELFAQSIHNYSYRYKGPFVAVNCAALPENLLESELFGYVEGSFTGSKKGGKKGLFEIANGGTIFLDEIGEISFQLQARLLRVLQEKEIIRIGGESIIPINVRIISATNKNLEKMIPDKFREDLFYRLNVLQVDVPPLRERDSDVIELFQAFLPKYLKTTNKSNKIKKEYLEILKLYSWPGNIRQLINTVERLSLEIDDVYTFNKKNINNLLISSIGEKRICLDIFNKHGIKDIKKIDSKLVTKTLIDDLLLLYPKQKNKIADILGISRTTLWRIINPNNS